MKHRKYRKKPVVVEAIQWIGWNATQVKAFCPSAMDRGTYFVIPTLEGNHICNNGDFIVKGIKGEFYPCKPDIFEATYEPAAPKESLPRCFLRLLCWLKYRGHDYVFREWEIDLRKVGKKYKQQYSACSRCGRQPRE